jgi:glutamyl-tRNA synthetase
MVPRHPQNESMGKHEILFSNKIYLDFDDAKDIKIGEEITLRHLGNVIIKESKENSDGSFSLVGDFNKDGSPKTTEKKLTWLPVSDDLVSAKLTYFDHVITEEKVLDGVEFKDIINPKSKWTVEAFVDPNCKDLKKSESIQLERVGYFICDVENQNGLVLFNTPDGHSNK